MELTVSNRTIIRVVTIVLGSWLVFGLIGRLHTQLIWIFAALFLTLALEPAVDKLSRYMPKRNRGLAVLTVLIGVGAVLGFVLFALIPPFGSQIYLLVANLPGAYEKFVTDNPALSSWLNSGATNANASEAVKEFSRQLLNFGGSAVGVVSSIFGGIVALVTVVVLTFFMVLEGPRWIEVFWSYLPEKTRHKHRELLQQMHGTVTGYVSGNLVKSLIATAAAGIALVAVGSPFALALALLVGILDMIPLVGATIGAIAVCLVVLVFKGTTPALIMAVFFIVFQQIENYVVQPLIFAKTVEVSPLITLLALIIGASLAGLIGALVAIPVAASAQILVRYWLADRKVS
jgi:predicted PurR-regulated permease PerM